MFYDFSFTIPANTTEADPQELVCKLTYGIIHRVEIIFPSGCAGLAHLQIREGLHQYWPTNPDGAFNSNDERIEFSEYLELYRTPYELVLIGWNEDDTYPHTLEVRFGLLPVWVLQPEPGLSGMLKKFQRRLRL